MIAKACFGAVGTLCLSAASPTYEAREVTYPLVHLVQCDRVSGTAFRVGKTRFLSVSHVTSNPGCKINGKPITVTSDEGELDFSELHVDDPRLGGFKINCEGFIPGQWVYAIGHAKGKQVQTLIPLYVTYAKAANGMRVFIGKATVIPGMSGGPILNRRGEVVGTVNAYSPFYGFSFSRELKDTRACADA